MKTLLRILLKIIVLPIIIALSLSILIAKPIFYAICGIGNILAVIFGIYGVYALFDPVHRWAAPPALISTFLVSPIGIPFVAAIIIVALETAKDCLKAI